MAAGAFLGVGFTTHATADRLAAVERELATLERDVEVELDRQHLVDEALAAVTRNNTDAIHLELKRERGEPLTDEDMASLQDTANAVQRARQALDSAQGEAGVVIVAPA